MYGAGDLNISKAAAARLYFILTAGRVCRGPIAAWLSSSGDPCRVGRS
jgi:hypothetical protein